MSIPIMQILMLVLFGVIFLGETLDLNPAPEIPKVKSSRSSSGKKESDQSQSNWNDTVDCQLLPEPPSVLGQLSPYLNLTQFVGLFNESESYPTLPVDQPYAVDCPPSNGSWWPGREMNLRSTCPWVYENLYLEANIYPRIVRQAVCICETCIGATSLKCEEIKQNVTVFRVERCRDGVAIFNKLNLHLPVGCQCSSYNNMTQS